MYKRQDLLYAIEQIPESVVLEGTDSIIKWFEENVENREILNAVELVKNTNPDEIGAILDNGGISTFGALDCGIAIATAVVSLVFAPTKILKIKDAIKALGGAYKLAEKAVDYYKLYRDTWGLGRLESWEKAIKLATKQLAPDLQEALLDFLMISTVTAACAT